MEVYLKRNRQPSCLHLFPLSVGRFQDFFAQSTVPGGQPPQLTIERFVSPIECLEHHLKGMALQSLTDVSQLNALVEKAERLGERDLRILSGALRMEHVSCLADVYRVVQNISDYELIGGVTTERTLGQWLVNADRLHISFPKEVRPYLDYDVIGNVYFDSHNGIFTTDGYVQRRENAPDMTQRPVFRLTLVKGDKTVSLDLPSAAERLDEAKRELKAASFEEAKLLDVQAGPDMSYLAELIPMGGITVEEADALASRVRDMTRTGGEYLKYCSALAVEEPATFSEALTIAIDIDDYERVPSDFAEYAEENLRLAGAGDEILNMLAGYTDFRKLGEAIAKQEGVRQTKYGAVCRLSEPFPSEEMGQTML